MKISDQRYRDIEQALQVFSFKQIQALLTLTRLLEIQEITVSEVDEYVAVKREWENLKEKQGHTIRIQNDQMWEAGAKHCPICGDVLGLTGIKKPKGKENVKGYTSLWFCNADDCTFEEYGFEVAKDIYKQVLDGTYNADN